MAPVKTTLLPCLAVLLMPALAPAQEVFKEITSERLEELRRTMKVDYKKDDAGQGTTDRLEKILNGLSVKYEKDQNGELISYGFARNNFELRLISFGGNDLMIDCTWNGAAPLAKLNQWNLKRHYVRAVLYDNNGKP